MCSDLSIYKEYTGMLFIESTEVPKPKGSGQSLHGEAAEGCSPSPGLSVYNSQVVTAATASLRLPA